MTASPLNKSYHEHIWRDHIGQLHRSDGQPAVIKENGDMYWYIHGKMHREDGPAMITKDDTIFILDGEVYLFDEWCELTNKTLEEITMLKLKYFS